MKNDKHETPYPTLKCKSNLVFDYETTNLKVENNDDINTKIYYLDKTSKTYSTILLKQKFFITINWMTPQSFLLKTCH